jgi:acyl-coenzyme A thioesterase PaaI-like protein
MSDRADLDPDLVRVIEAGTPFARTLGAELVELSAGRCVLAVDAPTELHNHVGGPHAATIFGLAETAAACVLASLFQDLVEGGCVPLVKGADIAYRAITTGPVTATATFAGDIEGVRASVATRGVAVFPVAVEICTADGECTATVTAEMALKRL